MKSTTHWNLTDLYAAPDDPAIEHDFQKTEADCAALNKYRGNIATLSSPEVLILIKKLESITETHHKLDLYAHLLASTNTGDAATTRFTKKTEERITQQHKEIIFIHTEFAHLPPEQWDKFTTSPELRDYHHLLSVWREEARHTLTEAEEKILAEKAQTSHHALLHLFQVTTDTLSFTWDDHDISLDELLTHFHAADPDERKRAAYVLHHGIQVNNKTTPALYNALIQDKAISDKLRSYARPEESRLQSDEVTIPMVEALVTAVMSATSLVERYYQLKQRILNVPTLYWWDRYAPLPETETKISIPQAKDMVRDAYQEFSPRTASIVTTMYEKQHIDWLPGKRKRGGAFCAFAGKEIYPYVLLNYTETPNDVMTLAHELGHAIHDVLAQEAHAFLEVHPSLALAEIASTFGESLLFTRLLKSSLSKRDKTALLMHEIEGGIATIFRQITMFSFEQKVHTLRKEEGELARETLDDLWHDTMRAPYGESLIFTSEHKNTWMYVPHIFQSPFYVYSYAFAQLCTYALLKKYQEQGSAFVETYLHILEAGGSLTPQENLARSGLDLTSPEVWQSGLSILSDYLTQLEDLVT